MSKSQYKHPLKQSCCQLTLLLSLSSISSDLVAWNLPSEAFVTNWNRTFSKIVRIRRTINAIMTFLSASDDTQMSLCFASWYRNKSSTVCTCSSHEPSTYDCRSRRVAYNMNNTRLSPNLLQNYSKQLKIKWELNDELSLLMPPPFCIISGLVMTFTFDFWPKNVISSYLSASVPKLEIWRNSPSTL